jgi:hypothetical protein
MEELLTGLGLRLLAFLAELAIFALLGRIFRRDPSPAPALA